MHCHRNSYSPNVNLGATILAASNNTPIEEIVVRAQRPMDEMLVTATRLPQNSSNQECTVARAYVAGLGSQLSGYGKNITDTGYGIVTVSGLGAILAPEALPLEIGGLELGADMIELGGYVSNLGATLEGYGRDGLTGGINAGMSSFILDKVSSRLTGGLFPGIDSASRKAFSSVLGQIPEALQREEAACGVK